MGQVKFHYELIFIALDTLHFFTCGSVDADLRVVALQTPQSAGKVFTCSGPHACLQAAALAHACLAIGIKLAA